MSGSAFAQEEPDGEADEGHELDGGQWVFFHAVILLRNRCCIVVNAAPASVTKDRGRLSGENLR
jgi:hypothetical protein